MGYEDYEFVGYDPMECGRYVPKIWRNLLHPSSRYGVNRALLSLTLWRRNYFFLILAHPVYKT